MVYQFIAKPEPDACNRCLKLCYSGAPYTSEFNIHEIDTDKEKVQFFKESSELVFIGRASKGRTGLFHEMCRCRAYVLQTIDKETGQIKSQPAARGAPPAEPVDTVEEHDFSRTGPTMYAHERQIASVMPRAKTHTRKWPGYNFVTVISNAIVSALNGLFGLKIGDRSDKQS